MFLTCGFIKAAGDAGDASVSPRHLSEASDSGTRAQVVTQRQLGAQKRGLLHFLCWLLGYTATFQAGSEQRNKKPK